MVNLHGLENSFLEKLIGVIVNRDSLRNMRGDYWIPSQETMITKWEEFCIECAIKSSLNVIIDATNFNLKTLAKWEHFAEIYDLGYEIKFFDTPVEECIKRDKERERSVGRVVIYTMNKKYLKSENSDKDEK